MMARNVPNDTVAALLRQLAIQVQAGRARTVSAAPVHAGTPPATTNLWISRVNGCLYWRPKPDEIRWVCGDDQIPPAPGEEPPPVEEPEPPAEPAEQVLVLTADTALSMPAWVVERVEWGHPPGWSGHEDPAVAARWPAAQARVTFLIEQIPDDAVIVRAEIGLTVTETTTLPVQIAFSVDDRMVNAHPEDMDGYSYRWDQWHPLDLARARLDVHEVTEIGQVWFDVPAYFADAWRDYVHTLDEETSSDVSPGANGFIVCAPPGADVGAGGAATGVIYGADQLAAGAFPRIRLTYTRPTGGG